MRIKTTLWLLICVLALGALVQFARWQSARADRARPSAERLLGLTAEQVMAVTVQTNGPALECERRDGGWYLRKPFPARADRAAVERLLGALESLSASEVITPEQRRDRMLTLDDYGLRDPRLRIGVAGAGRQRLLFVGLDAPLGDACYVRIVGEPHVFAVPSAFLQSVPTRAEPLRDREIFHGDAARAVKIELQTARNGLVQIARSGGRWGLQQPVQARADEARVERLANALFALTVSRFVWDPGSRPDGAEDPDVAAAELARKARWETYGLAPDTATRVSVWITGVDNRQELFLGKTPPGVTNMVYARTQDSDSIFAVSSALLDVVSATAGELRDRAVFDIDPARVAFVAIQRGERRLVLASRPETGWALQEPLQAQADGPAVSELIARLMQWRIADFVADAPTNPATYGLAQPTGIVQLGTEPPAAPEAAPDAEGRESKAPTAPTITVHLGATNTAGNLVYARFEGSHEVFQLQAAVAFDGLLSPAGALTYRNRTVLSVAPESVARLAFTRGRDEQTAARDEAGAWTRAGEEGRQVVAAAVEGVLLTVANLRASGVEGLATADLAPYGLAEPAASLTLSLTDGGIKKTILLGRAAPGGGVYAMVKGQDMIFTLPPETVQLLAADITQPLPAPPAP